MSVRPSVCVRVVANALAGERLRSALQEEPGLRLLDGEEAFSRDTSKQEVTVFIIDAGGLIYPLSKSLRSIRLQFSQARILALDRPQEEEDLLGLLLLGVHGFVPYEEVDTSLAAAVRAVAEGHLWFAGEILEKYVRYTQRLSHLYGNGADPFTPCERHIVELLRRRLANKEIATVLGISENTVKYHLKNVYQKLGVHDRYSVVEGISKKAVGGVASQEAD